MTKIGKLTERFRAVIDTFPIVDSHEHFAPDPDGSWPKFDLCDLIFHNLNPDLTASGMSGIGTHAKTPWPVETTDVNVKWKVISPYVKNIENMTSFKGLLIGLKEVYDFPYSTIDDSNWAMLNEQVTAAYKQNNWVDFVLKEKCNIKAAIVDMDTVEMDRDYLFPSIKLDYFMMSGLSPKGRIFLEDKLNTKIKSFEDFVDLLHTMFKEYVKKGAVAIKSVAAYYRTIEYNDASAGEAKRIFNLPFEKVTPDMVKTFQDFVMNEICRLTEKSNLPIQFHTGKLAWNFQTVENTNPVHLTNLLQKYPRLKFGIFHGGIPYTGEFGVLANNFPNAFLDVNGMLWTSISITKRCLHEWIEMVPQNKILWGADSYRVLEGTLGQLIFFKRILSEVLAEKISNGYFDEDFAIELAKKILYKNAVNFFSLQEQINI